MQKNNPKPETLEQAKERITAALTAEIREYQKQGMPNQVIGIKVFSALIDARLKIEQLEAKANRLTEQLDKEIRNIAKNGRANP